ncbi:amidase [Aromatoleum anaerobium]|uniref:Amidase n=1 Tax=Aromatoleum anaerobium TaxID=182180 RepID=A0ABX1PQ88_9RHOO|nr:amidase [Aromatoleum anaerobium]MCK0508047.1 amidase [Aromatoleum anaerobium]
MNSERRSFMKAGVALGVTSLIGVSKGAVAASGSLPLPEYERFDAVDLADLIRRGELTALEVLEAAITRAEARKAINAVAIPHFDLAREAARALSGEGKADRLRRADLAPLTGVPFALKDLNIALKGTVTTNGCAFFGDAVADHDSTLVERYRAAGLNIFAKLTSPEFGQTPTTESRLWGKTLNPWNAEYSAGGSSGGSAAAVAAGILPAAHASDGGGSIRIPASHCGLFGLKPSRGLVPMGPRALEGWMGLSVSNVITRSVRDSALLLQLTQGPEAGTRITPRPGALIDAIRKPPRVLRIALVEANPFGMGVHADCLDAVRKTAKLCTDVGHRVEPVTLQLPIQEMFAGMGVVTATGLLTSLHAREKALGRPAREDEFEPINWRSLQLAKGYSAEQVFAARAVFDQAGRILDEFFRSYDLILSPVTAAPPPKLGEVSLDQPYDDFVKAAMLASPFTAMFNMSGHPAMSVPLHWNAAGLPIGTQFAAPFGGEATLLSLAAQLEQAAPWKDRRPVL